MLRSLYLTFVYVSMIGIGFAAPFVLSLGYIWVSIFRPQSVASFILPSIPVSLLMGALAIGWFVLRDLRSPPRFSLVLGLMLAMAVWVTFTTAALAVAPESAWIKWDWAFKTIVFAAFMVFVFRSRVQIEALLQVILFSFAAHFLPVGLKTLISGGGYGAALGLVAENSGFGEGATLAAVALMCVPLALYLSKHQTLFPRWQIVRLAFLGLAVVAIAASIGSYQRTGLVGLAVLAVAGWLRSRHKVLFGAATVAGVVIIAAFASQGWVERMGTIDEYNNESSARGRILVWQWTLGFVMENPLGGGFNSFMINEIRSPGTEANPEGTVFRGKAFHSIYFEVLGEHGFPGLALLLGLVVATLLSLQRVVRQTRGQAEFDWCRDMAAMLQVALIDLLACGLFIGVAFQPMIWYLFAASACLVNHVQRALSPAAATQRRGLVDEVGWVPRGVAGAKRG